MSEKDLKVFNYIQAFTIVATTGYLVVEYAWPYLKRKFWTPNAVQQRLQLSKPVNLNPYEAELVTCAIHPSEISTSFEDVGGLDATIADLKLNICSMLFKKDENATTSRVYEHSKLFQAPKGVLLYGPPGCGKTLLAKALASESGARFINVPLSVIMSKWVGETEKYLEAVFSLAKKIKPAIIFIDEIDALTKRRNDYDAAWNSTMKSQFLTLWDGLLSENDSQIVVLGATNRRQDIDEAFLRRLPLQIKINLPNAKQREKILRILLSDIPLSRTFSFATIVSQTEGLSGSDLKEICRRVIMSASTSSDDEPYLHSSSFDQAISRFKSEMAHDMSHFNM